MMVIELQAVAMWATLHRSVSLSCMYIPPHDLIDQDKLKDLSKQLPRPLHSPGGGGVIATIPYGDPKRKTRKIAKQWIMDNDLCQRNTDIHQSINLPRFYMECVYDNTFGGDHFLIILRKSEVDKQGQLGNIFKIM